MKKCCASLAVLAFGALCSVRPALAGSYVYTTVGGPGSIATGISDAGEAVGTINSDGTRSSSFAYAGGTTVVSPAGLSEFFALNGRGVAAGLYGFGFPAQESVLYNLNTNAISPINLKPGLIASVYAINRNGDAVGAANDKGFTINLGFLKHGSTITYLDVPGSTKTTAFLISDSGTVFGLYTDSSGIYRNFTYANGTYNTFASEGAVNAMTDDALAGSTLGKDMVFHGFTQTVSTIKLFDYPGASYTSIVGFGPRGALFGVYEIGSGAYQSFVHVDGKFYPIQFPGSTQTYIQSADPQTGGLAGSYLDSNGAGRAFIAQCAQEQRPCTQ